MDQRRRPAPAKLANKLRQIRHVLGLSQSEMVRRLDPTETMHYSRVSEFELGRREPSLLTLLSYARVAGVHLEVLVDDDIALPAELPGKVVYPHSTHPSRR
ncbi:MAG TPA: helix-turn-helix transcriptional regulator [Pyrinomonadaceae bacterium]|nr:helix-turn-helix transcriptional regulator [Pyrinomonadaceae bacterium]